MAVAQQARVVIAGASNVALHLNSLLGVSREILGGPVDFLVAGGYGRAYSVPSRFLGRGLPAVGDCGLWPVLVAADAAPTYAQLTDAGNDLAYGVPPAQLAAAIAGCADRLCAAGAQVVVTLFPETSVALLASWRFYLFRSLLFPGRRFSPSAILAAGGEFNQLLRERLGSEGARGCTVIAPAPEWYGADRIHVRRRRNGTVWRTLLSAWLASEEISPAVLRASENRRPRLRGLAPQRSTLFGVERARPQPSATLADGTTISLF